MQNFDNEKEVILTSSRLLAKQASLIRYLCAGGSAFVAEYSSFYVMYEVFHVRVYVANSISFGIGLLVSFTLNRLWAFGTKKFRQRTYNQLLLYVGLAIVNLMITNVIVGVLKHYTVDPRVGKILAMFSIVCWNFFIFKFFIFASQHSKE